MSINHKLAKPQFVRRKLNRRAIDKSLNNFLNNPTDPLQNNFDHPSMNQQTRLRFSAYLNNIKATIEQKDSCDKYSKLNRRPGGNPSSNLADNAMVAKHKTGKENRKDTTARGRSVLSNSMFFVN